MFRKAIDVLEKVIAAEKENNFPIFEIWMNVKLNDLSIDITDHTFYLQCNPYYCTKYFDAIQSETGHSVEDWKVYNEPGVGGIGPITNNFPSASEEKELISKMCKIIQGVNGCKKPKFTIVCKYSTYKGSYRKIDNCIKAALGLPEKKATNPDELKPPSNPWEKYTLVACSYIYNEVEI